MRGSVLIFVSILSSVVYGQTQTSRAETAKALSCATAMNQALSPMGGLGYYGAAAPFFISPEGKTTIGAQNKIVSRETKDNVETIVYKNEEIVGYKDGQAITEVVRRTVQIKRDGGKVVAITQPHDLKKQAIQRAEFKKIYGSDLTPKLMKSTETTFRSDANGSCETEQKMNVMVIDEKGNEQEVVVNYDAALCDRLKPMINKIGANNAAQCGELLGSAERMVKIRNEDLKKEGKSFNAISFQANNAKDSAKFGNSTVGLSFVISGCVQEAQRFNPYVAGSGMPYGFGAGFPAAAFMGMGGAPGSAKDFIPSSKEVKGSDAGVR